MWIRAATVSLAIAATIAGCAIQHPATVFSSPVPSPHAPPDRDDLKRLFEADQTDRAPEVINWSVVTPRDRSRLTRVRELFKANDLHTAGDYYRSAMVLQHGEQPEDFLLAHEFCVAAMMMGKADLESSSLAAATEDRFLMSIGRAQRFGTQSRAVGNGPMRLYDLSDDVTDELRRLMAVPPLAGRGAQ